MELKGYITNLADYNAGRLNGVGCVFFDQKDIRKDGDRA